MLRTACYMLHVNHMLQHELTEIGSLHATSHREIALSKEALSSAEADALQLRSQLELAKSEVRAQKLSAEREAESMRSGCKVEIERLKAAHREELHAAEDAAKAQLTQALELAEAEARSCSDLADKRLAHARATFNDEAQICLQMQRELQEQHEVMQVCHATS